jgi:hypothetical protein
MSTEDLIELYHAKLALLEEMEEVLARSQELSAQLQEIDEEFSADEE